MSGVLPHKEKIANFFCSQSQKQITQIDGAQQSNKNKLFSNFVGHFHSEKSDFCTCVELRIYTRIFVKIHLGLAPEPFRLQHHTIAHFSSLHKIVPSCVNHFTELVKHLNSTFFSL